MKNRGETGWETYLALSVKQRQHFLRGCMLWVASVLKLGEFKAADKGQMELYLRWLAKHEQEPDEAPPLGIILCTGKKRDQIELLELNQTGIHVGCRIPDRPAVTPTLGAEIARGGGAVESSVEKSRESCWG